MLLLSLFMWFIVSIPLHTYGMDTEKSKDGEPSRELSNKNKVQFARNTFTVELSWDYALGQPNPLLSYRSATTRHEIPSLSAPPESLIYALKEKAKKENLAPFKTTVFYENETHKFVGCEDGTIHILHLDQEGLLHHDHLPCHNKSITSMAHVSQEWLAVGGGKNITLFNHNDPALSFRISFEKSVDSIIAMTEERGTLLCKTHLRRQIILYPYSKEIYRTLHGIGLTDYQKEVLFLAAHAFYEEKKPELNRTEQRVYETLVPSLRALITYFLNNLEDQR